MKFKLLTNDTVQVAGRTLFRIQALKTFNTYLFNCLEDMEQAHTKVMPKQSIPIASLIEAWEKAGGHGSSAICIPEGALGGYVESEANLSQEGSCWISSGSQAYEDALISENALVCGMSIINGNAQIKAAALVMDSEISGASTIEGIVRISKVSGSSAIDAGSVVETGSRVEGNISLINSTVAGDSEVTGTILLDSSVLAKESRVNADKGDIKDSYLEGLILTGEKVSISDASMW